MWQVTARDKGIRARFSEWHSNILFDRNGQIFTVYVNWWGESKGLHVAKMEGGKWRETPIPESLHHLAVLGEPSDWLRSQNCAWVLWGQEVEGGTRVLALGIFGTAPGDYVGPVELLVIPKGQTWGCVAVSAERIAMTVAGGSLLHGRVRVLSTRDGWQTILSQETRDLPGDALLSDVQWSPTGALYATRLGRRHDEHADDHNNSAELLRLDGAEWTLVTNHVQSLDRGVITSPKILFALGGKPIVVWDNELPWEHGRKERASGALGLGLALSN